MRLGRHGETLLAFDLVGMTKGDREDADHVLFHVFASSRGLWARSNMAAPLFANSPDEQTLRIFVMEPQIPEEAAVRVLCNALPRISGWRGLQRILREHKDVVWVSCKDRPADAPPTALCGLQGAILAVGADGIQSVQ